MPIKLKSERKFLEVGEEAETNGFGTATLIFKGTVLPVKNQFKVVVLKIPGYQRWRYKTISCSFEEPVFLFVKFSCA